MSKMLFGKAALTAIRLTDGTRANIPAGRAVPESIDPDDAERLLDEGFLVEVELSDAGVVDVDPDEFEPEGPNPPTTPTTQPVGLTHDDIVAAQNQELSTTGSEDEDADEVTGEAFTDDELAELGKANVDDTLDAVGDDPVKAQQVLDAENAREKPRTSLVAGLQDVLDAAAAEDEDGS